MESGIYVFFGMLACLIGGWLLARWTTPQVTVEVPVDLQKIRAAQQPRDAKGHFVKPGQSSSASTNFVPSAETGNPKSDSDSPGQRDPDLGSL